MLGEAINCRYIKPEYLSYPISCFHTSLAEFNISTSQCSLLLQFIRENGASKTISAMESRDICMIILAIIISVCFKLGMYFNKSNKLIYWRSIDLRHLSS